MSDFENSPHYHTLEEVKEIHKLAMLSGDEPQQAQSLRLGGENILGSVLARPQQAAFYEEADIIRQASLLCIGISQAQAFVDGNKRTAFTVTEDFLNSARLTIEDDLGVAIKLIEVAEKLVLDSSPNNRERVEAEFEGFLRLSVGPYIEPEPDHTN